MRHRSEFWDWVAFAGCCLLGTIVGVACAIGFCALGHWQHGIAWLR